MKIKLFTHRVFQVLALAACLASVPAAFAQGTTAFTYQGQLRDGSTNANGTYSLTFKLYDVLGSGSQIGSTLTAPSQSIVNGLFTVNLDFGGAAFDGSARWLEITVASLTATNTLAPRVAVLPAPYALFATKAGSLVNGAIQNPSFLGTTGNTPLELFVNNARILRLEPTTNAPNIIGGYSGNIVSNGFTGATIAGGGANIAPEAHDGLPSQNIIGANYATVGGGVRNKAIGLGGTVAGGFNNMASGDTAAVAGGERNTASNGDAFVGGGQDNLASGRWSAIVGGLNNSASGKSSFAAGENARATNDNSFVWSDGAAFGSTTSNQFSVRASGGVRFETGGKGLTVDGTTLGAPSQMLPQMQVFYTNGTFIVPTNATMLMLEMWGGGGGGGMGTNGYDGQGRLISGGGGGGAEYVKATITVTPGASYAVTVGQGGLGGVGIGANGLSGQSSSLGGLVTASGGNAGNGAPNYFGGFGGGNLGPNPQTHRVSGGNGQTYYDGKTGGAAVGGGFGGTGTAAGFEPGGGGSGDGGRGANGRVIVYY